jgi:hypothetical protein
LNKEEEMEELFDDEGVDEEFEIEGHGKRQLLSTAVLTLGQPLSLARHLD